MIDEIFIHFVNFLTQLAPEAPSLLLVILCFGSIIFASKIGLEALLVYNAICIIIGNIQVLKLTEYWLYSNPVSVGNIVFSSTFIATTVIIHNYGMEAAKKSIKLSFLVQIFFVIAMAFSTGHKITGFEGQQEVGKAFKILFIPQMRFIIASLISFAIGQYLNVFAFSILKQKLNNQYVWLAQNTANAIAAVVDNLVFSGLAWIIFAPKAMATKDMLLTYVLPGIFFRMLINFVGTPVVYKSFNVINKNKKTN